MNKKTQDDINEMVAAIASSGDAEVEIAHRTVYVECLKRGIFGKAAMETNRYLYRTIKEQNDALVRLAFDLLDREIALRERASKSWWARQMMKVRKFFKVRRGRE